MNLVTVNGHVFFPLINWRDAVDWSRQWHTGMETALDGSEARQAMRRTPTQQLRFRVDTPDIIERTLLEERIMAALEWGKAACPFWGRASELALDAQGNALTLKATAWQWQPGDWLFLQRQGEVGEGTWELRQIQSIDGNAITLDAEVTMTFKAGSLVWPVFFGRLRVDNMQAVTNHHGTIELSFGEPLEMAEVVPDNCSSGGSIFPVILSTNQEACGGAKLTWTRSINASSYKVKCADVSGGPYTLVATTTLTFLDIEIPLFRPKFYIVIAIRDDLESEPSNEVEVEPITVEREMRAMQERYRQGRFLTIDPSDPVDDWILWPERASDGELPGKYPAEGFYNADLYQDDVLNPYFAVSLIQQVANQFQDGWLNGYSSKLDGEFEAMAAIPLHSVFQEGTYERRSYSVTMPPIAVTAENYQRSLREIVTRLCALQWIVMPMVQTEVEEKHSSANAFKYVESFSFDYLAESWANNPSGLGDLQAPATAGWNAINWKQFFNFRYDNSDEFGPVTYSPPFPYGETIGANLNINYIGVTSACGSYTSREGEWGYHWAWDCSFHNDRGRLSADFRPFTRSEPRTIFLWMTQCLNGQTAVSGLPLPTSNDILEQWGKWMDVPPEQLDWMSPIVTHSDELPLLPPGAGSITERYFAQSDQKTPVILDSYNRGWQVIDQVVRIRKSNKREDGHWTYYP